MDFAEEPRPVGCRKILSEKGVSRIRVGDWRGGYTVDDNLLELRLFALHIEANFIIDKWL